MKKIKQYFLAVRKEINFLFVLSLFFFFTSFSFVFLFDRPCFVKLFEIILNLSLAFITSYIFYFIVIHLKDYKANEHIQQVVQKQSNQIISYKNIILANLNNACDNIEYNKTPNKEEIIELIKKIDRSSNSPIILNNNHLNWNDYFDYFIKKIEISINRLLIISHLLSPEFIALIYKLQECKLSHIITYKNVIHLPDIFISDAIIDLIEIVNDLEQYVTQNRKIF